MHEDSVDRLLAQWRTERPELDVAGLALVVRIERAAKLLKLSTARSLKHVGLKPWEYDVLSALRRQGEPYELPASELALASMLTSGAMTTRIDNLEARGFVRRGRDPHDRRGVIVGLTAHGAALIDDAIRARLASAETSTQGLSATERAGLERGLRKLLLSLSPIEQ